MDTKSRKIPIFALPLLPMRIAASQNSVTSNFSAFVAVQLQASSTLVRNRVDQLTMAAELVANDVYQMPAPAYFAFLERNNRPRQLSYVEDKPISRQWQPDFE
jgi:hypothetical protein